MRSRAKSAKAAGLEGTAEQGEDVGEGQSPCTEGLAGCGESMLRLISIGRRKIFIVEAVSAQVEDLDKVGTRQMVYAKYLGSSKT